MNSTVSRTGPLTRALQIILLPTGIGLALFGMLTTVPQLVRWTERYVSQDGEVTEAGVLALQQLRIQIIVAGVLLTVAALALGYLARLLRRLWGLVPVRIDLPAIAAATVSRLGSWSGRVYAFIIQERVLWGLLVTILLTIPVAGYFLAPAGGFHVEGIDLQPAKNLARHGIYGTLTTRGFDELTYRTSAGPAIVLPSALAFWVFGVNVYYSRAIALGLLIAAVLVFHRLAGRLFDTRSAWLGTFIVAPIMMMFTEGGNGMGPEGYMPGFLHFMVGALFWIKAIDRGRSLELWVAGLFWGLAFQTKWLYLFALIALIVTWILLRFSERPLAHRFYAIPSLGVLAVTASWTLFRVWNVGLRLEIAHLRDFWAEHGHRAVGLQSESGMVASLLSSLRPIVTLSQVDLWGQLQLFLIVPAVVYITLRLLKGRLTDAGTLLMLVFGTIWFSWWLVFNYDLVWDHILPVRFVGALFIGKLLADAWTMAAPGRARFLEILRGGLPSGALWGYLARASIAVIVLSEIVIPLGKRANSINERYHTMTKPYLEMVAYVRARTEKDAVFSGWAWSLPFYLDLDPAGDHITKDRSTYPLEQREKVPEYFIVSPEFPLVKTSDSPPYAAVDNEYNRKHNATRKRFVAEHCDLVKTFGVGDHHWLLYKVRTETADPDPRQESQPREGVTGSG